MGGRLDGKVAVVTGSTSGIGAGIARALAAEGARVVVSGRREPEGQAVVEAITAAGGEAVFCAADVAVEADCLRLIATAEERFGGLDVLVNNAGIFPRATLEETTVEFWDQVQAVNVRGAFICCREAVPRMRQRGGGAILNIGSCNAFGSGHNLLAYGVSKSALYGLTISLARHLAAEQIRVNWVTVGWVLTEKEYEIQAQQGNSPEALATRGEQLPMGEYGTVEDIAAACVYLASDEARHVTGCDLNASAGLRIRY